MTIETVRRSEQVQRGIAALGRAAGKARAGAEAVEVKLARGSMVDDDEVIVVVLGAERALVQRSKVRGRHVDLRELRVRLAGAEIAIDGLAEQTSIVDAPQLTDAEAAMLDEAGLTNIDPGVPGALERSRIEFELLLRESWRLEEAAKVLHVSTGRLRQRLSSEERTLYGFKEGRGWRIPKFQFDRRGKMVRGIEQVLSRVRVDAHPLAVKSWFTTPHQDLVVGPDEESVTPLAWLSAGKSPTIVATLAEEI